MNISNKNINKKKQTQPQGQSSAAPAATKAKTIKLGVDVHLALFVVTRIIDGSTPQPAQRFKPGPFLLWCARQLRQPQQTPSASSGNVARILRAKPVGRRSGSFNRRISTVTISQKRSLTARRSQRSNAP